MTATEPGSPAHTEMDPQGRDDIDTVGNVGRMSAAGASARPGPTGAFLWKLHAQLMDCSRSPERLLFLDVETTGLSHQRDKITIIGWSFGGCANTLIANQDPSLLHEDAARAKALVTFNGGRFDSRFIRRQFPEMVFPRTHIDIMSLCRGIGLRGGQKSIEKALGIDLRDDRSEMNGADAVVLWREYQRGDREALRRLILYNRTDVAAIGAILDRIVDRMNMRSELPCGEVRFRDWSAPPGWWMLSDVSRTLAEE